MPTKKELEFQVAELMEALETMETLKDDAVCSNIMKHLADEVYCGICGKKTRRSGVVIELEAPYTLTCAECVPENGEFSCVHCGVDGKCGSHSKELDKFLKKK